MSTAQPSVENYRGPPTSDSSNFNVSFNGNKTGQGFAIYIVPSGPPSESQGGTREKIEPENRNLEGRPTQLAKDNDIRMQHTFGNFSPTALHEHPRTSPGYDKIPSANVTRMVQPDDGGIKRSLVSQVFEKGSTVSHWKDARMSRGEKEEVYNWSRSATSKLLELYTSEQYFDRFKDRFTKKKVLWNEIADYLNREGFTMGLPLSGEQCANKFRNLKKVYVKCRNQNLNINDQARRFEYFPQLDSIFSQMSPTPDSHPTEVPREGKHYSECDGQHRNSFEHYIGAYHEQPSPRSDYEQGRKTHNDYVDLSHSPIESKPIFLDHYEPMRDRDRPVPRHDNEFVPGNDNRPISSVADTEHHSMFGQIRKPITPLQSNKRSFESNTSEVPVKVMCIQDSDEEPGTQITMTGDRVCPETEKLPSIDTPAQNSLELDSFGNLKSLFQKHLEKRNEAFENFMKSMMELHQAETKLLTDVVTALQQITERK